LQSYTTDPLRPPEIRLNLLAEKIDSDTMGRVVYSFAWRPLVSHVYVNQWRGCIFVFVQSLFVFVGQTLTTVDGVRLARDIMGDEYRGAVQLFNSVDP
jgi:hypothetical protein